MLIVSARSEGPLRLQHRNPLYASIVDVTPERWRTIAIGALIALVAVLVWVNRPSRSTFALTADPPGILREVRQLRELITIRYGIQKVTGTST
jgi:hypothetical protein